MKIIPTLCRLLVLTLLAVGAWPMAHAQEADEWTPKKFLEAVKHIADNVDLEDEAEVSRLLGIELKSKERPLPGKSMILKSQQADYLKAVSYEVSLPLEKEGGRKRAYIWLTLNHERFCVQLEDAHAVLGEQYEVPPPRLMDFWTPDGRVDNEAIARELKERDGKFDSIAYRRLTLPQGVSIRFHFRRCAREVWISRRLPALK